jgi:CheY-like chemotaxis protein
MIFNAVEAMPDGGDITVSVLPKGEYVLVKLNDTGIGMPDNVRKKVFEPFFTTRVDVGSGLGLSTAYSTITRWGGSLDVVSAPGLGSTFTIELPLWEGPLEQEEEAQIQGHWVPSIRRSNILVADDDSAIRIVLSDYISKIGHNVDLAIDGQDALAMFVPDKYEVALIDLGMPAFSGYQVAEQVKQKDPLMVTILITGWELKEGDPRLSLFDFQISKPFTSEEIEEIVGRALNLYDTRVLKKAGQIAIRSSS